MKANFKNTQANQESGPRQYLCEEHLDDEYDVVVIGSGIGGLDRKSVV